MNAADVMTRTILSVAPDSTIAEAVRTMLDNRISGLPVIDEAGRLVGILTEGDYCAAARPQPSGIARVGSKS